MGIEFDPEKRDWTLRARGLDFAKAGEIFRRYALTQEDTREDHGEDRYLTLGSMDGEIVVCVDPARRGSPHHKPAKGGEK